MALATLQANTVVTPLVFTNIVTLLDRRTGEERSLTVKTASDKFSVVLREVQYQKAELGLQSFEVFEVLSCSPGF